MVLALKSSYQHAGRCTTPVATALMGDCLCPGGIGKPVGDKTMGNVPHIQFLAVEDSYEV